MEPPDATDAYERGCRRHVVLVRIQRTGNGPLRRFQYFVALDGRDFGGRQRGTLATTRIYRARGRRYRRIYKAGASPARRDYSRTNGPDWHAVLAIVAGRSRCGELYRQACRAGSLRE